MDFTSHFCKGLRSRIHFRVPVWECNSTSIRSSSHDFGTNHNFNFLVKKRHYPRFVLHPSYCPTFIVAPYFFLCTLEVITTIQDSISNSPLQNLVVMNVQQCLCLPLEIMCSVGGGGGELKEQSDDVRWLDLNCGYKDVGKMEPLEQVMQTNLVKRIQLSPTLPSSFPHIEVSTCLPRRYCWQTEMPIFLGDLSD